MTRAPLISAAPARGVAALYVLLASDDGSYISGGRFAVTGGRPIM